MAQHDLEWSDQMFPPMRVDMNNALWALSTRQSGDGAPALHSMARPNRLYVDVTRKQVLIRNNDNTLDYIWDSWAQDRVRYIGDIDGNMLPEDVNRMVIINPIAAARNMFLADPIGNYASAWQVEIFNLGVQNVYVRGPASYALNGTNGASVTLEPKQGIKLYSANSSYFAAYTGAGNVTQAQLSSAAAAATLPSGMIMNCAFYNIIPVGWVRLYGGSIGNAASGASERANADTWSLYNGLWYYFDQAHLPVNGGRSGDPATDFNANKWITLPDLRGRTLFGMDNGAGRITGWAFGSIRPEHGSVGGEEHHVLQNVEMPQHDHAYSIPNYTYPGGGIAQGPGFDLQAVATSMSGSNYAHNTMPPGITMGVWVMKL